MRYTTQHIQSLYNVSPQTCRNWAEEFQRYLSVLAVPGKGRNRLFTEDDMRVFALIASMKDNGATYEEIHASLASGQRGDLPDLPPEEMQALVTTDHQQAIQVYKQQISALQSERDGALADLQKARDENIRLLATLQANEANTSKRIDEISDQLKSAQEKIERLSREIGRLESRGDNTH